MHSPQSYELIALGMVDVQKPSWQRLVDRDARCEPEPQRFLKNRDRLTDLAISMGSFSTDQLMNRYRAGGVDTVIGQDTPKEVLLALGFRYEFGRYSRV